MRLPAKSLFVLSIACVLAGCQKGGDTSQPTAAVPSPAGKDAAPAAYTPASGPSPVVKSDQDPLHPVYEIDTTAGKVTVRLDAEKAPGTVSNFRNYVGRGHYNQTIFHQVLKGSLQIVLGGAYTSDLKEKAALTPILNEAHNGLKNVRGTIAMARRADDVDSATCQFFFNLADNPVLDFKSRAPDAYGYCVFGEVTDGMDVLQKIASSPVRDKEQFVGLPETPVSINSIRQVK